MKQILSSIILVGLLLGLSGCAQKQPLPTKVSTKYLDDNKTVVKIWVDSVISPRKQYEHGSDINTRNAIFTIAHEAQRLGYPYFALINENINNLEGTPITNYKDLRSYCYPLVKDLDMKCKRFIHVESANLEAVFFKERMLLVPLWSVEEVLSSEPKFKEELRNILIKGDYENPEVGVEYIRGSL
ncbi:hypothetical protein [Sulfurospirillum cavolei]|uniref:hypothetical protein n=1 Tax=Sulfurospirillum cavolei TaxID=366522 RepID=UPI000764C7D1|nr:hypothetical protein [Sulfurospirillum cavolei]